LSAVAAMFEALTGKKPTSEQMREGTQRGWRDAVERGNIDPRMVAQEWSAAIGEANVRTCDDCLKMNGDRAPLGQPFPKAVELKLDDRLGPPSHPACRCMLVLVPLRDPMGYTGPCAAPVRPDWQRPELWDARGNRIPVVGSTVKYRPDQAREPIGVPTGGRFAAEGGIAGHAQIDAPEFNAWFGNSKVGRASLLPRE
jgi:hypothetical protein